MSIAFHDVTAASAARRVGHANRQLESAYEELQSTNEELETTNEELQSTVEELETTNEELQSTNEELETMNEELQSTNDELQTINDTLRDRTVELDEVNDFLESILTSIRAGVIVLDLEMRILAWNRGAEDLWCLRQEEARGEHLLNLDLGLPLPDLRPVVRWTSASSAAPCAAQRESSRATSSSWNPNAPNPASRPLQHASSPLGHASSPLGRPEANRAPAG